MSAHEDRIKKELKAAGVTPYGMMKFASRYAHNIIHEDEHIMGVVYGRYRLEGFSLNEGMLLATDLKILFLDHKPGYTSTQEITYDVVSGIQKTTAVFSAVTLNTKLGNHSIRFANPTCATIFVEYVEKRRLENPETRRKPLTSIA
jgi:hypothetical protein